MLQLLSGSLGRRQTLIQGGCEGQGRPAGRHGRQLTLGVGLLAVIAIIFGCAWIVRRMSGMTGGNTRAIKVVSVMPIGTRERIALVEVGGKQILIGVTPSAIRTLHVFDEPVVSAGDPVSSDFARKLQGMIGKSWGSGSSSKEGS